MHVCIVTDVFYPIIQGDVIRIYKDALSIKKAGHAVSLISPQEGIKEINCYKIKDSNFSTFPFYVIKTLLKINRKNKIDVIWCNRCYQVLPLLVIAKIIGAKLICEIHGPESKQINLLSKSSKKIFYRIYYILNELALRFVNKVIVVEEELSLWLEKDLKISKDKIVFIGNYPDLSIFKPLNKKTNKTFTVGYIGTLQKNRINPFLRLVDRKKSGLRYIVVGDGDDKEEVLKNKIIDCYFEIKNKDMPKKINLLDVGIIFSLSSDIVFSEKGPPIKLFEYLACGVPVITVNIPNLKTLIEDNGLGLVVDSEKLEEGIEIIRKNYSWYKTHVLRFRNKMIENYSWNNEKKKISQVLKDY